MPGHVFLRLMRVPFTACPLWDSAADDHRARSLIQARLLGEAFRRQGAAGE